MKDSFIFRVIKANYTGKKPNCHYDFFSLVPKEKSGYTMSMLLFLIIAYWKSIGPLDVRQKLWYFNKIKKEDVINFKERVCSQEGNDMSERMKFYSDILIPTFIHLFTVDEKKRLIPGY